MKKYVKEFIKRGLIFGSLGPVVFGIVIMILEFSKVAIKLEGWQILLAIITTYYLAFIQAGASIFEQIEEWSCFKAALIHLFTIYVAYLSTYLINSWIPLNGIVIAIFSASIIIVFFIIWLICFLISRGQKNKLDNLIK